MSSMVQMAMLSKGMIGSNVVHIVVGQTHRDGAAVLWLRLLSGSVPHRRGQPRPPPSIKAPAVRPAALSVPRRVARHSAHCRSARSRSTDVNWVRMRFPCGPVIGSPSSTRRIPMAPPRPGASLLPLPLNAMMRARGDRSAGSAWRANGVVGRRTSRTLVALRAPVIVPEPGTVQHRRCARLAPSRFAPGSRDLMSESRPDAARPLRGGRARRGRQPDAGHRSRHPDARRRRAGGRRLPAARRRATRPGHRDDDAVRQGRHVRGPGRRGSTSSTATPSSPSISADAANRKASGAPSSTTAPMATTRSSGSPRNPGVPARSARPGSPTWAGRSGRPPRSGRRT